MSLEARRAVDHLGLILSELRRHYDVADSRVAFSVNCFLGNGLTLAEIEA